MKKNLLLILFLIIFSTIFSIEKETKKRIKKYSGQNTQALLNWEKELTGDVKDYADFLLNYASANDLAILTPEILSENIEYAMKTKEIPYCKNIPENIFKHFVLPHRISQEPLENWRKQFYEEILPLVQDEENIKIAAIKINLWATEQMTFKQTHGRDQAPLTSIKRGYGRCEEMMILYIAAARAVGIPCRPASVPYWNFTDSNHAWIEIWTPEGWEYVGEPENSLSKAWFSKPTERATLVTSSAYGYYDSKDNIKQENGVTLISSIKYYTDFDYCNIYVTDEKGKPVKDANVKIYAASFGGLFAMLSNKTDKDGKITLPLGKSSVYVIASKDKKFGSALFNTINSNEIEIKISKDNELVSDVNMQFLISNSNPTPHQKEELLGEQFYDKIEIRNLSRDKRLLSQRKGYLFTKYYDMTQNQDLEDYYNKREEFILKCDEIAGNTEPFLKVFEAINNDIEKQEVLVEMIKRWDIKELCEIPDSLAIANVVNIYTEAKKGFPSIPDSTFKQDVIGFTFRSFTPPQNGWQNEFYQQIKDLKAESLDKTVENVLNWVDANLKIDKDYNWSYFSGSLNPAQILNMKNTNESYRLLTINCALKLLGVPVQYKKRLEYYNGEKYVEVEKAKKKEDTLIEEKIDIKLFVDGKEIKPDPWGNFLIGSFSEGSLSTTFFDGELEENTFKAIYRHTENEKIYLESYIRNSNGDANVHIIPINGKDEIIVNFKTPKEYVDKSNIWKNETLTSIKELSKNTDNKKIIFISGGIAIEPETRMLDQILSKKDKFNNENVEFYFVSENKHTYSEDIDLKNYKIIKKQILHGEIQEIEYPAIFVLDKDDNIIFTCNGYNMGLGDLILKKIK